MSASTLSSVLPSFLSLQDSCLVGSSVCFNRLREFVDDHTDAGRRPYLCTMNGDFLSPSLLSSFDMGAAAVAVMNEVGFTHYCFGNHEFDIPLDELQVRE